MSTIEIVGALRQVPPLHARVDGVFLPLSVRQNRVEDIFLDFLRWLAPDAAGPRGQATGGDVTADGRAELILAGMRARPTKIRLPDDPRKVELIRRWIRTELVVEPRQSNRASGDAVSIVPLHSCVARYFELPGRPPAYGRFICELLARTEDGSMEYGLLDNLSQLFGNSGSDPVARLLEAALGPDERAAVDSERRFRRELGASRSERLVWCSAHGASFRRQVASVLAYRDAVGRKTFVEWLYAVFSFFVSTYLLRMAQAAESYSAWLEGLFAGEKSSWGKALESPEFAPRIGYGRRNASHSALLKRFPSFTSVIVMARHFAEAAGSDVSPRGDLDRLGSAVLDSLARVDARSVFEDLTRSYPTKEERQQPWKLSASERDHIVAAAGRARTSPFTLAARILNFEDMARASNNVMEWQFYSTLARHSTYGFAARGRSGDVLHYRMSDALLVALAHCHMHQRGEAATQLSFMEYLTNLGFTFDADGRSVISGQLVDLGLVEDLSDAGDARFLRPIFSPARPIQ